MLNLNDLKVGDSVRFKNGQVAKVVDIKDKDESLVRLYFDKKVASDIYVSILVYDSFWWYETQTGKCSGRTNHIVKIKKGEKTMNKNKIAKSLEWHKKKVAELEEALKQPDNKRWFPKKDEMYYAAYGCEVGHYQNCYEECTKDMYSTNNVFKTQGEAEKELARRKAETELLDMCDWTPYCEHMFMIFYDRSTSNFDIDYFCAHQFTPHCFATRESAQKAVDTLGEEKLKLIFRI